MDLDQVVGGILAAPAPIVALDSCSILDILRVHYRTVGSQQVIDGARALLGASRQKPKAAWLLVMETVKREVASNRGNVLEEGRKAIKQADDSLRRTWEVAASLDLAPGKVPPIVLASLKVTDSLEQLLDSLLIEAVVIDEKDEIVGKARRERVNVGRRPAQKGGKGMDDAVIIEHVLALSRSLRYGGFTEKVAFVTSNSRDFMGDHGGIHPDLEADFAAVGLSLATNMEHARALVSVAAFSPIDT